MNDAVTAQGLSLGHALDVAGAASGVVHSVFEHAVNLMLGGEMWTILAESKRDLPLGIRVAQVNFLSLKIRPGDEVKVRAGFLSIGGCFVVDCRVTKRWKPTFLPVIAPGFFRRIEAVAAAACNHSWRESASLARAMMSAFYQPELLGPTLAKVVGSGLGATPSGDDVLVGILAVLSAPLSGEAGARCLKALRPMLMPMLSMTTDVSAHLLRQATRGWVGRDLHDLIEALAGNSSPSQLKLSIERVVETGATSGADACMGILAAAPSFFIPQQERAAA